MEISDRQYEEKRLQMVLSEVKGQIQERRAQLLQERESQIAASRRQWEEELPTVVRSTEDLAVLAGETQRVAAIQEYYRLSLGILRKLEKMASSPYFARIDFKVSPTGKIVQIYIGISSLVHRETGTHLVFDWRAPVSSMFYDYELGPAQYSTERGVIRGELLLKRQFKIKDGRLVFMFDNSLTIDDDILQEVLSQAQGDHMRAIVNTIQKEQNQVIRNETARILAVQGVAGSGKTSIALHRAAYLLYKHRDTMKSESIVIFSPNRVFNDYISEVLPELGENNISQTTFRDFAQDALDIPIAVEDVHDHLEYMLTARSPVLVSQVYDRTSDSKWTEDRYRSRMQAVQWKSSPEFVQGIKNFARFLEKEDQGFQTICHGGKTIISKEELLNLFETEYTYLPLHKRLDKIRRRVWWLMGPVEAQRRKEIAQLMEGDPEYAGYFEDDIRLRARQKASEEFRPIRAKLDSWASRNVLKEYIRLFQDDRAFSAAFGSLEGMDNIRKDTVSSLSKNYVRYEDLAPLLLLKRLVEGFPEKPVNTRELYVHSAKKVQPIAYSQVRHVIIDEAQDYSLAQFEVLKRAFPNASMTVLGDLNQSLHPHLAISGYRALDHVFSDEPPTVVNLRKSYRSTKQIAMFARMILPDGETIESIDRPGPLPVIVITSSIEREMAAKIASLCAEGIESVAVICKTAREGQLICERLRRTPGIPKIHLVRVKDSKFVRGVVVIPSYLARGIEFEAVLVSGADREHYAHPDDRKLLHMVCTRALHRLFLFCSGDPSPFLARIDPSLYELVRP
ncbi:MAG: UvrD-helicase domain-containing protein [Bacillota bacterium]|jgi:DNA helicase-2/ATP-dependent DNA helicase PcrA